MQMHRDAELYITMRYVPVAHGSLTRGWHQTGTWWTLDDAQKDMRRQWRDMQGDGVKDMYVVVRWTAMDGCTLEDSLEWQSMVCGPLWRWMAPGKLELTELVWDQLVDPQLDFAYKQYLAGR
jgi:hypothetical protein